MALKDWKKTSEGHWRNIKDNKNFIELYPYNNSYIVQTEKGFNAEGLITIASSKVKANKRAREYMKKH